MKLQQAGPKWDWKEHYRKQTLDGLLRTLDLYQQYQQVIVLDNNEGKYLIGQSVRLLLDSQERIHQIFEVMQERIEELSNAKK